jgi:hypothetical protein
LQIIDGVQTTTDMRVLVPAQTNGVENGVYRASATAWQRDYDFDGFWDVVTGTIVGVTGGTLYAKNIFQVTTTGEIIVGTTSIAFGPAYLQVGANYTHDDLLGLNAGPYMHLNSTQYGLLPTATIQLLTPAQISTINSALQLAAQINHDSLGGLNTGTYRHLTTGQISLLATTQTQYLTTTQIASLDSAQVAVLNTMTTTQIAQLSSDQLSAVGQLTTTQIAQLSSSQMSAIGSLTTTQISQLSSAQVSAIGQLTTTQIAQLSSSQVAAIGQLTTTQIAQLSSDQMAAVGQLSTTQIAQLSSSQMAAVGQLTTTQIAQLASGQLLTTTQVSALTETTTYIAALPSTQIAGMTTTMMAGIGPALYTRFFWAEATESEGVSGGATVNDTYYYRAFDAPKVNNIGLVYSGDSSEIRGFPDGVYQFEASSVNYKGDSNILIAIIQQNGSETDRCYSSSGQASSGYDGSSALSVSGYFTITIGTSDSRRFVLTHWCGNGDGTVGGGKALSSTNYSLINKYADVKIWKVG